jgi:hypothetical protein
MNAQAQGDSCGIDESATDGCGHSIREYRETITVLQEEVARLERELELRDDPPWETVPGCAETEVAPFAASESARAAHAEVERLQCELAKGEQTVALLLDQLSFLEEAKAADRSEWEQLIEWVAELEKRVEGQDENALRQLQTTIGDQQRELESLRLRAGQESLERTADENSDALRLRLGEIQNERNELRHQLSQSEDERKRERLEYETTVAELRTRLSQASLIQHEAPQPVEKPDRRAEALESDLRIRALRQHLLEIHQREEADRRERRLTHRLSRLWSRTSPR